MEEKQRCAICDSLKAMDAEEKSWIRWFVAILIGLLVGIAIIATA